MSESAWHSGAVDARGISWLTSSSDSMLCHTSCSSFPGGRSRASGRAAAGCSSQMRSTLQIETEASSLLQLRLQRGKAGGRLFQPEMRHVTLCKCQQLSRICGSRSKEAARRQAVAAGCAAHRSSSKPQILHILTCRRQGGHQARAINVQAAHSHGLKLCGA